MRSPAGLLLAAALAVLAPVSAEYVTGYDTSTGDPLLLLAGLMIFVPLYGAPAVLVREIACRRGLGWWGVLLLAAALGLVQAGLLDQSLFNSSYRDIDSWEETLAPTLIAPLGFGGAHALNFVAGHAIWSFTVPIALVQGLSPEAAGRPWLRRRGLVLAVLLYVAAAALIWSETQRTEADHASPAQLLGASVVVGTFVVLAFTVGKRRTPTVTGVRTPAPGWVAAFALVLAWAVNLVPETWTGVAVAVAGLVVSAGAIAHWARSPGWQGRHVVTLAGSALLGRAVIGFLAEPLGDVDPVAKYAHNTFFAVAALALTLAAYRRSAREEVPAKPMTSRARAGHHGA